MTIDWDNQDPKEGEDTAHYLKPQPITVRPIRGKKTYLRKAAEACFEDLPFVNPYN